MSITSSYKTPQMYQLDGTCNYVFNGYAYGPLEAYSFISFGASIDLDTYHVSTVYVCCSDRNLWRITLNWYAEMFPCVIYVKLRNENYLLHKMFHYNFAFKYTQLLNNIFSLLCLAYSSILWVVKL